MVNVNEIDENYIIKHSHDLSSNSKIVKLVNDVSQATKVESVSSENITLSAGAAGTTGKIRLTYAPIMDSIGGSIGYYNGATESDSSLSLTSAALAVGQLPLVNGNTETEIYAALTNGTFSVDYSKGVIYYKKGTTGTTGTVNYKYTGQEVDLSVSSLSIGDVTSNSQNIATEATLSNADSTLTTIAGLDFATETTLTSIDGKDFATSTIQTNKTQMTNITDGTNELLIDASGNAKINLTTDSVGLAKASTQTDKTQMTRVTNGTKELEIDANGNAKINLITDSVGLAKETTLSTLAGKDFATETTLATLEGKDFATETTLTTLAGKDFATETTLETIKDKLADIEILDANAVKSGSTKVVVTQNIDSSGNIGGGSSPSTTADYKSPGDFTATYTSNVTITLSGVPVPIVDSAQIGYIKVIPSTGNAKIFVNGSASVTIRHSANVLTISGAGTPFAAGDVYEVGINGTTKAYDLSTDANKTISLVNVWNRYTDPEVLVTAQDLTDAYADYGSEIDMRGYNRLGVYIITDVNDSQNVKLQVLGKHTPEGTDEYTIDGIAEKDLWTTSGTDSKIYYEFDIKTIPYIQLQAKAGTVGTTPGDLSIVIDKKWRD